MLQQLRHLCAIPPTLLVLSLALFLGGELLSQQPLASHQSCTQTASFGCLSSSSDISCAKLTPPLTLSRAWNAASHFLHLFVPCWSFGVRTTLTVRSAKRHPHQVSHSAKVMFHDVRRIRGDTFPCRPVETAQHCSGPSGFGANCLGLSVPGAPLGTLSHQVAPQSSVCSGLLPGSACSCFAPSLNSVAHPAEPLQCI